jgi:hypothetical protein
MSDGLLTAQDIAIKSCKIIGSSGQPMEFKYLIVEFNYFEDIFAAGISGSLLINDSMGYINILQLQGYEVLILEIDKPGLGEPIKKDFRISNISNRTNTKGSNENYIINFCSEELLINEQYKISKSYKNTTITDIIKSICTEYLKIPDTEVEIDKTIGLRDIVLPNFKPIQAINWLSTFAKSDDQKNVGSPFLFYEDRDGFKFKSMLTLFQQNVYRKYQYDIKGLNDPKNSMVMDFNKELVNVLQYEQIKSFDSITAVRSGAMSNKMHTVDPVRLKLGETTFNYDEYTKNMDAASLNAGSLPTSATNRLGDTATNTPGVVKFCMTTTGQSENKYIKDKKITVNENRIEETVPLRTAQLALFCTNRLKLLIPGDVDMTVGRVIEFNLPQIAYNNSNRQKENDEYFSGKYLVTAVRHLFNQENKFFSCIEICKESTPQAYNDFNNQKVSEYR